MHMHIEVYYIPELYGTKRVNWISRVYYLEAFTSAQTSTGSYFNSDWDYSTDKINNIYHCTFFAPRSIKAKH